MEQNIGKRVKTNYGQGFIKSIDLPKSSRARRYLVELDDPKKFHNINPCYFPEDKDFEILTESK